MLNWKNLDTLASYEELKKVEPVNVAEVMSGENGAERVKNYSIPMMDGLTYNYAAKAVDEKVLAALAKLAEEAQRSSDQYRRETSGTSPAYPWSAWQ